MVPRKTPRGYNAQTEVLHQPEGMFQTKSFLSSRITEQGIQNETISSPKDRGVSVGSSSRIKVLSEAKETDLTANNSGQKKGHCI